MSKVGGNARADYVQRNSCFYLPRSSLTFSVVCQTTESEFTGKGTGKVNIRDGWTTAHQIAPMHSRMKIPCTRVVSNVPLTGAHGL